MSIGLILLMVGTVLLVSLVAFLWALRPGSRWGLPPHFGG